MAKPIRPLRGDGEGRADLKARLRCGRRGLGFQRTVAEFEFDLAIRAGTLRNHVVDQQFGSRAEIDGRPVDQL